MNKFMKRAVELAKKADPFPNPRVGAVLVKDGRIIGEGFHRKAGMNHAEIEAIEDAIGRSGNPKAARGATMYVSLEPCSHTNKRTPPCVPAIIRNGIRKVVYGMKDPNSLVNGALELERAGVEMVGPTNPKEAAAINREYLGRFEARPFVAIKMAASADGKSATRTGDSKWIGSIEERDFVARLRNEYDAIMVGTETIIKDDPKLTSRIEGGRNPLRIIVDGKLRIPLDAGVLRNPDGKTIVATTEKAPAEKIRSIALETEAHVFVCGRNRVDLAALSGALAGMGIKKVLIEGGSEMNASALEAGIVDRIYLFMAPIIIGGRDANGIVGGRGIERISQAKKLGNPKIKKIGPDLLLQYEVIR